MFRHERKPQTFENHVRIIPIYHLVAFGILVVSLVASGVALARQPGFATALAFAVAFALIVLFFAMRVFALTVQDRVIRLEERLRLERLLPSDQHGRIVELTTDQLVALRFASDAEVAELVRAVIDERLSDRKAIKRRIRAWRPDYQRC